MGMFDNLHHDGEQYQTKDTPRQFLDNYKIESDQESGHTYLWHEEYDAEYIKDDTHWLGIYMRQSNHRWVRCDDFDGLIRFYRNSPDQGWIEYQALFMDGQMIKLTRNKK